MRKSRLITPPPSLKCDLCSEHFVDQDSFDAHQRPEIDRHQQSNRFSAMPKLPKCYGKEAMWAQGFHSKKYGKVLHLWSKPVLGKKRAHKINPDDTYQCLFCNKHFNNVTPFMAHFIHTWTDIARCLDTEELQALDYDVSASGVWRATPSTQLLPSQVNRLPTVRQELEVYEARKAREAAPQTEEAKQLPSWLQGVSDLALMVRF